MPACAALLGGIPGMNTQPTRNAVNVVGLLENNSALLLCFASISSLIKGEMRYGSDGRAVRFKIIMRI